MTNLFSVLYSPEAKDDLSEIYSYIAFQLLVPETAEQQVDRIRKMIRSLDSMPLRFPIVEWEPWKSMEMHKMPVDNFIVFYLVDQDSSTVTIIRIVYGGRNITDIAIQENK